MIIDSHCHLSLNELYVDLDNVLKRAACVGVSKFLNVCTKYEELPLLKEISEKYKNVFYSVGVHPLCVSESTLNENLIVKTIAESTDAVAIGEVGIDRHYNDDFLALQKKCFVLHIEASILNDKPLIIHTRDAENETYDILKAYKDKIRGVIHCFTGDLNFAKSMLDLGFYISFSGILTYKNNHILREVAKIIPENKILIETDAPFLSPGPHRGKPCEPAYIIETAKILADLRHISFEELSLKIEENFNKLFSL